MLCLMILAACNSRNDQEKKDDILPDVVTVSEQRPTEEIVIQEQVNNMQDVSFTRAPALFPVSPVYPREQAVQYSEFLLPDIMHHEISSERDTIISMALKGDVYNTVNPINDLRYSEMSKFMGIECSGFDLTWYGFERARNEEAMNLNWLIFMYRNSGNPPQFFNDFFDKLAGTNQLRMQILGGMDAVEIRKTWQKDLDAYKLMRQKYMLYQ